MRSIKPRELIQILQNRGFYIHHQKGSHIYLKTHLDHTIRVTVPLHKKDLKIGTLLSILRQANLSKEDLG